MNEEKKKKNKIIGISIGILVVLLVVISSTYAYWQITKSQDNPNKIVAACLDFDVDFPVGITEENKWPMSSSKAMSTIDGYTFTVTNKCPEDVTYVIGLESVTSDNIASYLSDTSVGIGFDGINKGTYSSLIDIEGPTANARGSKKLQTAIVKGKSDIEGENVNTHNLKLWIDESSDVKEQNKGFSGKLFITGGQKVENDMPNELTAESCFEMDGEEIIGYDESCGESVIIPANVYGTKVTTIDTNAFKEIGYSYFDSEFNPIDEPEFNPEKYKISQIIDKWLDENGTDMDREIIYWIIYSDDEQEIADIKSELTEEGQEGTFLIYGQDEIPELKDNQMQGFITRDFSEFYFKYARLNKLSIKELDLSQAYNLENIEEYAFTNLTKEDEFAEAEYGLTKLNFGDNKNKISISEGTFAYINVDNLVTYTTLAHNMDNENLGDNVPPFYNSIINNLEIKATNDETEIYNDGVYNDVVGNYISGLYFFTGSINSLKLHEGITLVPAHSFSNIATVELPSTLKNIGSHTFGSLKSKNLIIPEGVETIGKDAFIYGELENVSFPSTLKSIGENSFKECKNLKTINLNEGLISIGAYAFSDNNNLTNVSIPSTIQNIGGYAFRNSGTGTIFINRSNLDGVNIGTNWNGNLVPKYN